MNYSEIAKALEDEGIISDVEVRQMEHVDPTSVEKSYILLVIFNKGAELKDNGYQMDKPRVLPVKFNYTDKGKKMMLELFDSLKPLCDKFPRTKGTGSIYDGLIPSEK